MSSENPSVSTATPTRPSYRSTCPSHRRQQPIAPNNPSGANLAATAPPQPTIATSNQQTSSTAASTEAPWLPSNPSLSITKTDNDDNDGMEIETPQEDSPPDTESDLGSESPSDEFDLTDAGRDDDAADSEDGDDIGDVDDDSGEDSANEDDSGGGDERHGGVLYIYGGSGFHSDPDGGDMEDQGEDHNALAYAPTLDLGPHLLRLIELETRSGFDDGADLRGEVALRRLSVEEWHALAMQMIGYCPGCPWCRYWVGWN